MVTVVITNYESEELVHALSHLCNQAFSNTRKTYRFSCEQVLDGIRHCFKGEDLLFMNDLYNFYGNGDINSSYADLSRKYRYSVNDLYQIEAIKLGQLKKFLKKQKQFQI